MNRILVVNVNWLGDVIFSSPVFRALKESYPEAKISCLAVPRVKEVLESVPFIDEVIVYDEKGMHWNLLAKLKLIWQLRQKHFNAAFLLHRSWTRAFLVWLAGIPVRVGYDEKNRGKYLTHRVKLLNGQAHRSDRYLNVIESFGVKVYNRWYQLNVSCDAEEAVARILASQGIKKDDYLIVVNPGGNWDLKRWPKENFACLINRLSTDLNVKIVISGAKKDVPLVEEIKNLSSVKMIDLTGQTSFKQAVALMKRADVVISADSGPLHIANSVGSRVIGIFGPTRPEITGPRGEGWARVIQHDVGCNRKPCYYLQCPDNICMQSVTVEDVLKIVRQIKNP